MKLATYDQVSESKNESVCISTVFMYRHGVVPRAGDFTFTYYYSSGFTAFEYHPQLSTGLYFSVVQCGPARFFFVSDGSFHDLLSLKFT